MRGSWFNHSSVYADEDAAARRQAQLYPLGGGLKPSPGGGLEDLDPARTRQPDRRLGLVIEVHNHDVRGLDRLVFFRRWPEVAEHRAFDWVRRFEFHFGQGRIETNKRVLR